ncbi:MAG: hypothetical protein HC836_23005 [Richelia sp. RM2_1_2]|nr:hypothetical protein [Richelia sp. RM2_1_2]
MKRTLTEVLTFDSAKAEVITEEAVNSLGQKNLYLKGIFLEGDVRNHNQRVYPVTEIRRAVEALNESIKTGESVLGEADHPEELNINLDRVSHVVTEMWMDGARGMGKLKILPTPMGNIVRTMLENGVKLGVSSRGSGNVDSNGRVSEFEIVTVDIVAKPSAPNAYPAAIYERRMHNGVSLNDILNVKKEGIIIEDLALAAKYDPKAQQLLAEKLIKLMRDL